ncbi:MAG TPA: hypothetical protein VIW73_09075 [Candidatus Cybelea sp.]
MTDEELQRFVGEKVRLTYEGSTLTGKLVAGFEAQLKVEAPYAIEWHDTNETTGTNEMRIAAINDAKAVGSIELLDVAEETKDEIEDEAEETQTPG